MNKKVKYALNFVVVILFIYLATKLDYKSIIVNLKAIPLYVLGILVCIQLTDMFLVNYQNQRLAKLLGYSMSFFSMNFITSMGFVFDAITPGGNVGGEAVKIMMLKKYRSIPLSTGTAMVLSQKIMSFCALICFFIIAFFYLTITTSLAIPFFVKIIIYIGLSLALILAIYMFYNPNKFIKKCEKIKHDKIRETLINFLSGIKEIAANRRECIIQILISSIVWFIYPIKLYLLIMVTNADINFIVIYAIIFLSYGIATVPIFPGGMLGFEVAMSSMLALYGISADKSLFITTLFRFLTFWFVIGFSLLYIGVYKIFEILKPKKEFI